MHSVVSVSFDTPSSAPASPADSGPLAAAAAAARHAGDLRSQGRLDEAEQQFAAAFAALQEAATQSGSTLSPEHADPSATARRLQLEAAVRQQHGALLLDAGTPIPAQAQFAEALRLRQMLAVGEGELAESRAGIESAELALLASTPTTYGQALRGVTGWWRGALAIVGLVAAFVVVGGILSVATIALDVALGNTTWEALARGELSFTPLVMLGNNLGLAALIPLSMLLQWALFGVRPRFLSSVSGGFRWRWFGRLALVIVPVWAVYIGISLALDPVGGFQVDGTVIAMLAVVLLTTPLQSAGEEYGARGLIQRATESWFQNSIVAFIVGTLISGAFFAAAHVAGDIWLIAYYLVFALGMSLAARWSGGLEAPVLVHMVNNVLLFIPTALAGATDDAFERDAGAGGPFMLLPMAICLAVPFFVRWWARRAGVAVTAALPPTAYRGVRRTVDVTS